MADLPANTITVVENNSGTLGDIALSSLTHLTFGVNLTPLIWILLAELLVLGLVGSLYAIRRIRRSRKQMITAVSQMVEHYARGKNTRLELQQNLLEEQFQLNPEKAALASRQMLENEQAFLSALTQTLTHWDMRRLSRIHLELEQANDEQLIALASAQELGLPVVTQPDNMMAAANHETPSPKPGRDDDDINLVIPESGALEIVFAEEEQIDQPPDMMLMLNDDIEEHEIAATRQKSVDKSTLILELPEEDQSASKKAD